MKTLSLPTSRVLLWLGALSFLLTTPLGCGSDVDPPSQSPCDPTKKEPGTGCEKVCDTLTDGKGEPCEREGQTCIYADVNCDYEGVCKNGVWEGETECTDGNVGGGGP